MAATSVFSGTLAAGATLADQTAVLTPPFRGLEVEINAVTAKTPSMGLYVMYATSIDAGATYSDFKTLTQLGPTASQTLTKSIMINEEADHIKFRVMNGDALAAYSALSITINQFT